MNTRELAVIVYQGEDVYIAEYSEIGTVEELIDGL